MKFTGWINYETTQEQLEGKLKDTKTDYRPQLSLGKSPQLLFKYQKIESINQSSLITENGIFVWQNFYSINKWYKLKLKYTFDFETQFHFLDGKLLGLLKNIN